MPVFPEISNLQVTQPSRGTDKIQCFYKPHAYIGKEGRVPEGKTVEGERSPTNGCRPFVGTNGTFFEADLVPEEKGAKISKTFEPVIRYSAEI